MNPEEIRLIRASWARVQPSAAAATAAFYERLFILDPALRPRFKRDLAEQQRMLVAMLHLVVSRLDDLDGLVPAVRSLGARDAGYGVDDDHYETVGDAFLWMLEHRLGAAFTPATRAAWTTAYGILAGTMQTAAREAAAPVAA